MGSSPFPVFREVSPIRRSDDTCRPGCTAESMYHHAGEIWSEVSVLFQTAESGKDYQVFEGGIEVIELEYMICIGFGIMGGILIEKIAQFISCTREMRKLEDQDD